MKTNVRTTFRHIRSFDELNEAIEREARKLQGIYSLITNCRVIIDRPHHNDGNKKCFRVRVVVSVPGKQLISSREARKGYFDILTAVTETFNTVRNSVNSYMRRRNGVRCASRKANTSARWEYPLDLNDSINYAAFP